MLLLYSLTQLYPVFQHFLWNQHIFCVNETSWKNHQNFHIFNKNRSAFGGLCSPVFLARFCPWTLVGTSVPRPSLLVPSTPEPWLRPSPIWIRNDRFILIPFLFSLSVFVFSSFFYFMFENDASPTRLKDIIWRSYVGLQSIHLQLYGLVYFIVKVSFW